MHIYIHLHILYKHTYQISHSKGQRIGPITTCGTKLIWKVCEGVMQLICVDPFMTGQPTPALTYPRRNKGSIRPYFWCGVRYLKLPGSMSKQMTATSQDFSGKFGLAYFSPVCPKSPTQCLNTYSCKAGEIWWNLIISPYLPRDIVGI